MSRAGRIYQKIGYGYLVAIGVGFCGTLLGMVVADYYQGRGLAQLADANEQVRLLFDFRDGAIAAQRHGLQMPTLVRDRPSIEAEAVQLQAQMQRVQVLLADLQAFIASRPSWLATEPQRLENLLLAYYNTLAAYTQAIHFSVQEFDWDNSTDAELEELHATLEAIAASEQNRQLNRLNLELTEVLKIAQTQQAQSGEVMEEAQGLEKLIVILSGLCSVAIALLVAYRTTRAIALPLGNITQVAQQAASESNFQLRVPVTGDDEIACLAQSLNFLIESVSIRTQELQKAVALAESQTQHLQQTLSLLQETQSQLIHSEKMSSLGQMVAGIAHEVNNPINFVYGNVNYAQRHINDLLQLLELYQTQVKNPSPEIQDLAESLDIEFVKSDLAKLLNSMKVGTERIRSIVLSLRIFSRLDEADCKPANLHEGIDSTLLILGNRLKAQAHRPEIKIVKVYDSLPLVECYAGQVNQVFMNILANAIDALDEQPDNPQPTITIRTEALDEHWLAIAISDNGPGIPENVQKRLFDPFYTTKAVGKGTGLGLSISYKIIKDKHRGSITCDSTLGKGTTFIVKIPFKLTGLML